MALKNIYTGINKFIHKLSKKFIVSIGKFEFKRLLIFTDKLKNIYLHLIFPIFISILLFLVTIYAVINDNKSIFNIMNDDIRESHDISMILEDNLNNEFTIYFDLLIEEMPVSTAMFKSMLQNGDFNGTDLIRRGDYYFIENYKYIEKKIPLEILDTLDIGDNEVIIGFKRDLTENFSKNTVFIGKIDEGIQDNYSIFAVSDISELTSDNSYKIVALDVSN